MIATAADIGRVIARRCDIPIPASRSVNTANAALNEIPGASW
jgi:hypothetical protein